MKFTKGEIIVPVEAVYPTGALTVASSTRLFGAEVYFEPAGLVPICRPFWS
jgi:hypothetical protein